MINNKKGFLLGEETVKLILAVIAIVFLVVFIVYLYNNFSQDKELEQAKSSLAHLTSEISAGSTEVEIFNPTDWLLLSFSSDSNGYFPKSCASNGWTKCLCICVNDLGAAESPTCDNKGTCQQSDFSLNGETSLGEGTGLPVPPIITWKTNSILISNPPLTLSINQQTKTISPKTNGA